MKIGIGYDVHQLVPKRKLILGGVEIKYDKGLYGHSDADVLVHAINDAIIGALGLGDIGIHFPDSDISYKDISSIVLLKRVIAMMKDNGYEIINSDNIIIMEEPKIYTYFNLMKKALSEVMEISEKQINIKATTTEGLGFCGRKEGVAAQSIILLHEI